MLQQQMPQQQNIVIIGGGMVGVSLALLLSRVLQKKSVSITLVEQFAFPKVQASPVFQPSFDERSTALSAGSIAILQQIGCWPLLKNECETIASVHVSDRGHFGGVQLNAKDYNMDALGYVVENRRLGSVLIQQLQLSHVECIAPATVKKCIPKKKGYTLIIDQANTDIHKQADLVLVADGADSQVRQSLGIDTDVTDYQQSALIANVSLDRDHNRIAYERFTDEGPLALLPLPTFNNTCRAALVWTVPSHQQESLMNQSVSELLTLLQQRFGFRGGNIIDIGKRHIYPLKLVKAKEQVRSHLVVVGNAAHFLHPVAGQGFNLALRDCQALADCLRQAQDQEQPLGEYSHLSTYLEAQAADQYSTIELTHHLVKLFSSQRLPLAVLRQLGFMGMHSLPFAKHQFAQKMMGVF